MSDETQGPVMLAVTNVLRPPPARVGKISDTLVLPRTIELRKLLAAAAGVFIGLFAWMFPFGLFFGYSFTSMLVCALGSGFLAVFFITWSPMKGESFARWLGLSTSTLRADRVRVDGLRVRAYLGIAPLPFTAAGRVQLRAGAVDVPAGSVDERGVPLSQDEVLRSLKASLPELPDVPLTTQGFEEPKPLDPV